ncbi:PhoX family protein [Pseudoduganella albidiflava]|uniref:Phosphatase n=1 Tax=Pseudoduganella albidiflava TaxID=321983 RepID=A0A411WYE1_9BURK|nr:PhoX family phosphatase [Pseudoduganella albidiflava]QBI01713.1 PhoX family phosphatase [Pseudoduganella albidiflava]GGY40244.1 phosphatase [Pseudoduganella albidiflava]
MTKPHDPIRPSTVPDDDNCNNSSNDHFNAVLAARMSRRSMLRAGFATAAGAVMGTMGLSACGGSGDPDPVAIPPAAPVPAEKLLAFAAVPKSLADTVAVPASYTATILYALGDPLRAATPAYKNDGTDTDFDNRAGDHHDGMEYFGLTASGVPSASGAERGVLAMNHEATTAERLASHFLHADGGTATLPRPAAEVDKEVAVYGISVIEVKKTGSTWSSIVDSPFNRRLTPLSDVEISGPARGNALLVTQYSPAGTRTRGTLSNCGGGRTPWGTYLSGEENWAGYFVRGAADDAARGNDKSVVALRRYGRRQGATSRHGWETGGADDRYQRWDISRKGASANGSDDYRNEMNGQGYLIEVDPYDKTRTARKRSALGRFAHESGAFGNPVAGQPLAVYMGDDSRNEYIYKFVSKEVWNASDATPADRIGTGDKYLDSGTLYVARVNADGTGQWIELSLANPLISAYTTYPFADLADVLVNARLAADAVGATRMDRPEWCSVHPVTGEVYYTLTNNSNRSVDPGAAPALLPDAGNPRVYTDMQGAAAQNGNPNGHIIRFKEGTGGSSATSFTWDVYLFAAESGADATRVNLSGLTADQDHSSPDGLAFVKSTGICWIQTDDDAYADVTNNMMLAAVPGQVGDGARTTLAYDKADGSKLNVDTFVGKKPTADTLKRFLVGPSNSEITGITETPDGKALFINIMHPGLYTARADIGDPARYKSQWPANAGYGAGKRPRSATIVITKNDGGRIGT